MVNILRSTSAKLDTNPKFISTQVTLVICDDINLLAIFHHQYSLLDDCDQYPLHLKNSIRDYLMVIIRLG